MSFIWWLHSSHKWFDSRRFPAFDTVRFVSFNLPTKYGKKLHILRKYFFQLKHFGRYALIPDLYHMDSNLVVL